MPYFNAEGLKFLRGLARHNDREWFEARKGIYEQELKAPMQELIAAINEALPEGHQRPPTKAMMRIYRDVRFSKSKLPYKTHLAAWWAREGMEKTSGGGFYFQLGAEEMTVAAGVYMPEREQLLLIRRHLLEHHAAYRKMVANKKLLAVMTPFDGVAMTRAPKGFPAEHPGLDLVMQRQWGVSATLPSEVALGEGLLREITRRFRVAAPLVSFLNTPLGTVAKKALF